MNRKTTAKDNTLTWVEVSAENIRNNISVLKKHAGEKVNMLAVIKANAYGHDACLILPVLQESVEWIGVASVSEAENIRKSGCNLPILVFAPVRKEVLDSYKTYALTAVAGTADELNMLIPGIDFHIELDTGMGRLGFYPDEWDSVLKILQNKDLKPSGIMTHFASSDTPDNAKTIDQIHQFRQFIQDSLNSTDSICLHASNTGGLLHYPDAAFDMVRAGIGIYGYAPDASDSDLKPALSWKTVVSACKPIKKGMSVSYQAAWKAPEDGFLIILPVGYADGVYRQLSGSIKVRVGDTLVQQVGMVTMDYMMLYHNKPVETGTEVEILGNNSMTADDWAELTGTISYEIICRIHPKIKRVLV